MVCLARAAPAKYKPNRHTGSLRKKDEIRQSIFYHSDGFLQAPVRVARKTD
jgi:hypothetical protein